MKLFDSRLKVCEAFEKKNLLEVARFSFTQKDPLTDLPILFHVSVNKKLGTRSPLELCFRAAAQQMGGVGSTLLRLVSIVVILAAMHTFISSLTSAPNCPQQLLSKANAYLPVEHPEDPEDECAF